MQGEIMLDIDALRVASDEVKAALAIDRVDVALVLGSGWSAVLRDRPALCSLDYEQIPILGATQVAGHAGTLAVIEWQGLRILVFLGRRHWYEGQGWTPVVFPVFLSKDLGARTVVLTNAAGGIRPDLTPGTLMVIDDHINMMGSNPLLGPHHERLGPRFPDQSAIYTPALRECFDQAGADVNRPLAHGVYVATSGPVYETPAEVRSYASLGGDAVGMSTVPEATVAAAMGLGVAGLSCITNSAAGVADHALSHQEVIETTERSRAGMRQLLDAFFAALAASGLCHEQP